MLYFPILHAVKSHHKLYRHIDSSRLYYPIPKNGTTTMHQALNSHPEYEKTSLLKLDKEKPHELVTFLRNPIDRFWAGAVTGFYHLHFESKEKRPDFSLLSHVAKWMFMDQHLMPQFFYLLNCYDYSPKSVISFYSYKDISTVLNTNVHKNPTIESYRKQMQMWLEEYGVDKKRILDRYPLDKIMWDEFVNKTLSFDEIRKRFKSENYLDKFRIGIGF